MIYFFLMAVVIVCDQLTKLWVLDAFQLYESRVIIPGFFNLTYVTNSGAAFSLLADVDSPWRHFFFLGTNSVAIAGFTIAYFYMRRLSVLYGISFGLIAGGAAGNLVDRARLGSVVDFLDVYVGSYHWPTFNVADSAICVGVAVFIYLNYTESRNEGNLQE